jgi:hypothetical protein
MLAEAQRKSVVKRRRVRTPPTFIVQKQRRTWTCPSSQCSRRYGAHHGTVVYRRFESFLTLPPIFPPLPLQVSACSHDMFHRRRLWQSVTPHPHQTQALSMDPFRQSWPKVASVPMASHRTLKKMQALVLLQFATMANRGVAERAASRILHPLLITTLRHAGLLKVHGECSKAARNARSWTAWIRKESEKRILWGVYAVDCYQSGMTSEQKTSHLPNWYSAFSHF